MKITPSLGALALTVTLVLTGCSGSGDPAESLDPAGAPTAKQSEGDQAPGVPKECAEPFPYAMGPADLADVEMLPAQWPDPPAGSTLCVTSGTVGESQENADYASDLPGDAVLAAYEAALEGVYDVTREEDGLGAPILTGVADGAGFQISTDPGRFRLTFVSADG